MLQYFSLLRSTKVTWFLSRFICLALFDYCPLFFRLRVQIICPYKVRKCGTFSSVFWFEWVLVLVKSFFEHAGRHANIESFRMLYVSSVYDAGDTTIAVQGAIWWVSAVAFLAVLFIYFICKNLFIVCRYNLCTSEKAEILKHINNPQCINRRNDLNTKCLHMRATRIGQIT